MRARAECSVQLCLPLTFYPSPYPDGLPGHRGHTTEHWAAQRALSHASTNMQRIFDYLVHRYPDGATDYELMEHLHMFSAPKRRCDLLHLGRVRDSGWRRNTPRRCSAIVWQAVME